jgi:hypothetical protein
MYPHDDTEVRLRLRVRQTRELRERLRREVEWSRAVREAARELMGPFSRRDRAVRSDSHWIVQ